MASLVPRLDVLPDAQRRLWPSLQPAARLGFVLYGGTAISLRLGHRQSVDFDFFTDRPLDNQTLNANLPWLSGAEVLQEAPNTLTVLAGGSALGADASESVKVSFFGAITFGRLADPDVTSDGVAQVASLEDLLATKLKALLQRVEAKDYLDIVALLGSGVHLDRGLAGARALYGLAFQPAECLKALVYFQGGDLETLPADTRSALISAAAAVGHLPPVAIVSRVLALSAPPSGSA
jgi:hypothetical protein